MTVDDRDSRPSYGRWQARIRDTDGTVRGSGVLISERHVLTCAHVLGDDEAHPRQRFSVDFPRSAETTAAVAGVIDDGWFPESESRRDIAILEISDKAPADVRPARIGPWEGTRGRPAIVFGHPEGLVQGLWTETRIVDSVGERIQLTSSLNGRAERIEPGYSGGGVIEAASGRVIGIVVTAYLSDERIVAFMIPMETVASYWRTAAAIMGGPAADDLLGEAALDELTAVLGGVRELAGEENRAWIAQRLPEAARLRLGGAAVPSGSARSGPGQSGPVPLGSVSLGSVQAGPVQAGAAPSLAGLVRACRGRAEMRVLADLVRYRDTDGLITGTLEDRLGSHGVGRFPTETAVPHELGTGERRDLHRVLLQQPAFGSRPARAALFDEIDKMLGSPSRLTVSASAHDDAWALVDVLRPVPGSLRAMLAFFRHGDEFDRLEMLVDLLSPYRLLTDAERDDLVGLLGEVPPEPIAAARRHAGAPADAGAPGLASLVRGVEEQSQLGSLPRIFMFVEHVAAGHPPSGPGLQIWSDRCAARQHLQFRDLAELRIRSAATVAVADPPTGAPALVIQLTPDALRPAELFQLSAALQREDRPQHLLANSDDAEPLEVIRARVDALFGEVYRELGYEPATLTVEVVLPRVLLHEAVDRWDLTDLLPVPLGSRFVVVLRSYERLRQDRLWPSWRHKWRLAQTQQVPSSAVMHYLAPDDPATPAEIAAKLRPDHKLVLASGRPPARQSELRPHDAYAAALQSGVAYVVWTREEALAEQFRALIERALAEAPVRDLPRRIARLRTELNESGADPSVSPAGHVSLLACDFDRKIQFTQGELKSPRRREQS